MTDYQKAKIYKIVDNTNQNVYIGSTCKTLERRLSGHVADYKCYLKGKGGKVLSFDIIMNNDYDIILIEAFPCDYKDELLDRERYWTTKINCINKNKPGLLIELGRVEYNKQYHNEHKDQINELKATKCDCVCGGIYTLSHKARHMKSEKHRKYVQTEALKKCLLDNLTFEETKQIYNKL